MARLPLPSVLFPGSPGMPPAARLCLLGACAFHFAAIRFLIILPSAEATVPLVFVVGLSLLWAPRPFIAILGAIHAAAGLLFFGMAMRSLGDRHGTDLFLGAIGLAFFAPALMLGFAWMRVPRLQKPPKPEEKPAAVSAAPSFGVWPLAAAAVGIAAVGIFLILWLREPVPSEMAASAPARDTVRSHDVPLLVPQSADKEEGSESLDTTFLDQERDKLGEPRYRSLSALLRNAVAGKVWSGNAFGGRRYYLPGTFADDVFLSDLGCRQALLERFNTELFRSSRIETEGEHRRYSYARPLSGDTVLPSLGCLEIPVDARYYALRIRPGGMAAWARIDPWYTLSVEPDGGGCREDLPMALRVHAAGEKPSDSELILAARDSVVPGPFPYAELVPARGGPAGRGRDSRVNLMGFDSTRFRSCWIENRSAELPTEDGIRTTVVRASFICETRSGFILGPVTSEYPRGTRLVGDAGIDMVRMADFDGDGYPDILVYGFFMGTRIYFLEDNGVRDSLQVEPDQIPRESC